MRTRNKTVRVSTCIFLSRQKTKMWYMSRTLLCFAIASRFGLIKLTSPVGLMANHSAERGLQGPRVQAGQLRPKLQMSLTLFWPLTPPAPPPKKKKGGQKVKTMLTSPMSGPLSSPSLHPSHTHVSGFRFISSAEPSAMPAARCKTSSQAKAPFAVWGMFRSKSFFGRGSTEKGSWMCSAFVMFGFCLKECCLLKCLFS